MAESELVAVPLENGGVIVVEMDQTRAGVVKAMRPGEVVGMATQTLEAALESVTSAAQAVLAKLRQARPQEITAEFGLKLDAEVGVIIAKTASACHLNVTLRWKLADDTAE